MTETELADRLERLERDNRQLKTLATVALILAAALGAIYASRPVPDKITAHEFDVVDAAGRARVKIYAEYGPDESNPEILITDPHGKNLVSIGTMRGTGSLNLWETYNDAGIGLGWNERGPLISFIDSQGRSPMSFMVSTSGDPNVTLSDPQGYSMELGSTGIAQPTTGATQQTSAASIVMVGNDKDHHVIWKAP